MYAKVYANVGLQPQKGLNLTMEVRLLVRTAFALSISLIANPGNTMGLPDSGSLYRETKKPIPQVKTDSPATKSSTPLEETQQTPSSNPDQNTPTTLHVKGFRVFGNTQLTQSEIESALAPFGNKNLSTQEIHQAANELQSTYVNRGYFAARVLIPPQAIENGIIFLYVYEGHLAKEGLYTQNSEQRVSNDTIHTLLQENLIPGGILDSKHVERAILLSDDLAGIHVESILSPGTDIGTANLIIKTHDQPFITGSAFIDNYGNYYTGEARAGAWLFLNSPAKKGDQITLNFTSSGKNSNYGFMQYNMPIGGNGFAIGGSVDWFDYTLGKEFKNDNAEGSALEIKAFVTYPVIRSRLVNLYTGMYLSHLALEDKNDTIFTSERDINTVSLNLHGEKHHTSTLPSTTQFYGWITAGSVYIAGNELYQEFDSAFTRTHGSFAKIELGLSHLQTISGPFSSFASINGQVANQNLDSSQKFYLGGPNSVSGYPIGEVSGDNGALFYIDLRYDVPKPIWNSTIQLATFYSYGWAKLYKETWPGWQGTNSQLPNKITLKTLGISAFQAWENLSLHFNVGYQIGSNPGDDPITGKDADNSSSSYRAWLQLTYDF